MAVVPARAYAEDQPFFVRLAIGLTVLILFGFIQFAARGQANYAAIPFWVPLHGLLMVSWLALFVTQNRLATRNLALHRRLGKLAAVLVAGIVVLTCFSAVMAVRLHRVPPFFTPPFFLALSFIEALLFAALVLIGVSRRRDHELHRRLMFGATIVASEPAFGRLLPMPFMIGWGEWVITALQLGLLAIVARHDKQRLGKVHPATAATGVALVLAHVIMQLASTSAPLIALADRLGG